jgi:hypothetical protein
LKALNEKLLGRLGYVTLMERMSVTLSTLHQLDIPPRPSPSPISASNSKADLSRPTSAASSREEFEKYVPGSRHSRKAAFWMLLAAREWYDAKQYQRSIYCINKADDVYGSLEWTRDPEKTLGRLLASNAEHIELERNIINDRNKVAPSSNDSVDSTLVPSIENLSM